MYVKALYNNHFSQWFVTVKHELVDRGLATVANSHILTCTIGAYISANCLVYRPTNETRTIFSITVVCN